MTKKQAVALNKAVMAFHTVRCLSASNPEANAALNDLAMALADQYEMAYPKFNRASFLRACGVNSP